MSIKKHLPNLLTLLNLLSGIIGVIFAVKGELTYAAYFVFLGIFFDFFDGFAARMLNVSGELGKQLDSLADVVTSGVVPGVVMYQLILLSEHTNNWSLSKFFKKDSFWDYVTTENLIAMIGLLIALSAAYRLAKFNIDERQTSSFIGLPTPAAALVVLSLPLIMDYGSPEFVIALIDNTYVLIALTLILCYAMNAEIPLFSLKFKNYTWAVNKVKFIFIGLTVLLVILLKFAAIPVAILLYVLMSLIANRNSELGTRD